MSVHPELFIIINDSAARARRVWPLISDALTQDKLRFDVHEAKHRGDAQARARMALYEGYRTIAVVGGDGTLSEVASGFFTRANDGHAGGDDSFTPPSAINPEAALAILPGGTGNDFARGLERRRATLDSWLNRLIAHCQRGEFAATTRAVDVMHGVSNDDAHAFICLNAATLGIGAEVAGRVAAQKKLMWKLSGEVRFGVAAVGALAGWRLRRVRIRVDEEEPFECRTNLIAIANSPYAGGGMMFSPDARVDDGLLDIVTASDISRAIVVREMTRIHSGGHLANPRVRIMRGKSVRIENLTSQDALAIEADGDVRGYTPLEFRIMPGALRVVF